MADAQTTVVVKAVTDGVNAQIKQVEHAIEGLTAPVNAVPSSGLPSAHRPFNIVALRPTTHKGADHGGKSAVFEYHPQRLSPPRAAARRRGADPGRAGDAVRGISAALLAAGDPHQRIGRPAAARPHPRRGPRRL